MAPLPPVVHHRDGNKPAGRQFRGQAVRDTIVGMGHNESRNPFKRARLGLDRAAQAAVDADQARSGWAA